MTTDTLPVAGADLAEDGPILRSVLALNTAHEVELSPLSSSQLVRLAKAAFAFHRIGNLEAFMIAFDQAADYDSPNFIWFRDRYERFVYVDRIVVAAEARGRGHARRLYHALFALAGQAGHDRIVCEVNSTPPNPQSDAFHLALGFAEVGAGPVPGSAKTVRYLLRHLPPANATAA